ncbi:MAG: cytoplasmic protein [Deltaproteobacteria bacterium]|nr:cytoplasmic protein [Deltaproteobacteria bacterium]
MNPENFIKQNSSIARQGNRPDMFKEFDATELYCPKCKRAVPVKKRLLLVLPEGDKYEYRCAFCLESVGSKIDKKKQATTLII